MSFSYPSPSKDSLGEILTPPHLAEFIYRTVKHLRPRVILDPCCGTGNLLNPWSHPHREMIGIDIRPPALLECEFLTPTHRCQSDFLEMGIHRYQMVFPLPNLVLCNPPWNRSSHMTGSRVSVPEQFLRKIVDLCGNTTPIVFLCPMGFRLNQRCHSKRWRWISKTLEITSIISVPLDLYPNTQFHSEVILFNVPRVKPHYFLNYLPRKEL